MNLSNYPVFIIIYFFLLLSLYLLFFLILTALSKSGFSRRLPHRYRFSLGHLPHKRLLALFLSTILLFILIPVVLPVALGVNDFNRLQESRYTMTRVKSLLELKYGSVEDVPPDPCQDLPSCYPFTMKCNSAPGNAIIVRLSLDDDLIYTDTWRPNTLSIPKRQATSVPRPGASPAD